MNEKYYEVDFTEVIKKLSKFCSEIRFKTDLTPQNILNLCLKECFEVHRYSLDSWSLFEKGLIEISSEEMLINLFGNLNINSEEDIVVVLDSCFERDKCFIVKFSYLIEFENVHNDIFENSDFFGPFDHLFFIESKNILVILHHEGDVLTIRNPDNIG